VVDPQPHRRVHIQVGDIVGVGPGNVGVLVVDGQITTQQGGSEEQGDSLADFAIGERNDVAGVGLDTNQAGDLDVETGFLFDFPHGHTRRPTHRVEGPQITRSTGWLGGWCFSRGTG